MQIISWSFLFVLVFLTDLLAVYLGLDSMRFVTKSLLMPLLGIYFLNQTAGVSASLKKLVLFALGFSWLGDMSLMFVVQNEMFFTTGLIFFLIAHIFYILFFDNIQRSGLQKTKYWLFLPVLVYYVILISVLSPTPDFMKWPVRFYGIVISYMLIKALHCTWILNRITAVYFISGAILFVISDSILALDKFNDPIESAGILVMSTYGLAQFLLVTGAVRYLNNNSIQ